MGKQLHNTLPDPEACVCLFLLYRTVPNPTIHSKPKPEMTEMPLDSKWGLRFSRAIQMFYSGDNVQITVTYSK